MTIKCAIYLRCSTNQQSTDSQLLPLKEYAEKSGYEIVEIYDDVAVSGTKVNRPAFDKMIEYAKKKRFNSILSYSVDRCGRNIKGLCDFVELMHQLNISLYFHTQNIDTSTAMGKCFFHIFSSISFMEREMCVERVKTGLANAKKNGVRLGRPSNLTQGVSEAVKALRERNMGVREICRKLQIGCGSYYKIINEQTV